MSIRLRLSLWYAAFLALLLAFSGVAVYLLHARAEYQDLDDTLAATTGYFRNAIQSEIGQGVPLDQTGHLVANVADYDLIGVSIAVYDASGAFIYGDSLTELMVAPDTFAGERHAESAFKSVDRGEERARVHAMTLEHEGAVIGYVQTSTSLAHIDASMERLRLLLVLVVVLGVLAATAGGITIASRALRPIAKVTATARAIAQSRDFGRRLEATTQEDELGVLIRTLNEMLTSLDAAYRSQRRFVDDAAHELRAPLTSMLGNFEFLERARDLPAYERADVLNDVRAETEHLAHIVADLLALARADSGQTVVKQPVELDQIIIDAVHAVSLQAGHVDVEIRQLEPTIVTGDMTWLRQLIVILVENACRYTPHGGQVAVALERHSADAVISVTDTGIGIAPEDLPHVFDRFYRADAARSRVVEGSGLGLAIASWIVRAHGGTIGVASQVGAGSQFTVHLPAVIPSSSLEPETKAVAQRGN